MTGIEVLREVRQQSPDSKLLLLTAYADTDVAIRAINDIALDYYLMKPWDPPEERLYPVLDELLARLGQRPPRPRLRGARRRAPLVRADRGGEDVPHPQPRALPLARGRPDARRRPGCSSSPAPASTTCPSWRCPTAPRSAPPRPSSSPTRSACAPAPSSRSTTSASSAPARPGSPPRCTPPPRGCATVVVERDAPGGQAGQSASIENYLGFPKGLSGADLTHRAVAQASRFGAEMVLARDVVGFETRGPVRAVLLDGSADIEARAVLVASGVSYRRLEAPGLDERRRARALLRRQRERGDADDRRGRVRRRRGELGRAGGAQLRPLRQAGRAGGARRLARGVDVAVPRRPDPQPRPTSRSGCSTEVVGARGDGHLEAHHAVRPRRGARSRRSRPAGSSSSSALRRAPTGSATPSPATARGFVLTGPDLPARRLAGRWTADPFALETSVPGVFAAGDVRRDSMKRVASAVGEGAMSVYLVHRYLATT